MWPKLRYCNSFYCARVKCNFYCMNNNMERVLLLHLNRIMTTTIRGTLNSMSHKQR